MSIPKYQKLYETPAELMDKYKFKVLVYTDFEPQVPSYFLNNAINPFHNPEGHREESISFVSTSEIVSMVADGTEFCIYKKEDIYKVIEIIKTYIEYVISSLKSGLINKTPELEEFIKQCDLTLKTLEHNKQYVDNYFKSISEKYGYKQPVKSLSELLDIFSSVAI